jgi:hypothetical protein
MEGYSDAKENNATTLAEIGNYGDSQYRDETAVGACDEQWR